MSPKTEASKKIALEMLTLAVRDAVAAYALKKLPVALRPGARRASGRIAGI